uniref:sn-1-specific diacylglycerol lipase ABHD11 n=1 Tax=Parasteatoda tepidariorum TaxID=114398 RepID=A0A2L2XVG1_PARTP
MASCKPIPLAFKVFEASKDINENNPIIFLHGLGAAKEHWNDIPQKVAEATHRRVYAIDARNHGDSAWTDEFNFDLNAVDLMHFIDQIAAEKVTIVGHSMGGVTCMKTALKIPSKVHKVIIEDIGIVIPKDVYGFIKLIFSLFQEALSNMQAGSTNKDTSKFFDFVYERIPDEIKPLIKRSDEHFKQFMKQNPDGSVNFRANFKGISKTLESEDTLVSEYEGVYDGPTCFICGEKSMFPVKQDAENIKKFFPNAQFISIKGTTHDVHTEEPQLYLDTLLKFLKE